jgi:WD40 repeat protein
MRSGIWGMVACSIFFIPVVQALPAEAQPKGAKMDGLKIELESQYEDPVTGVNWLAVNRQGTQLLAGNNLEEVTLLDARNLRVLKRFPKAGDRAAFALDEKLIVAAYTFAKTPLVSVIDPSNDKVVVTIEGRGDFQCHSRLNYLASCRRNEFFVYDLAKRKILNKAKLENPRGVPRLHGFSKNGILGVEPFDGKVFLLWYPPFDKEPVPLPSEKFTESAAFSPDERHLALGDEENKIDVWNLKEKAKVKTLTGHTDKGIVRALAYSPDGRFLAGQWGSSVVVLWDTKEYREVGRIKTHDGFTKTLVFFPDSQRFATACNDGHVKVWKITEEKREGK